MESEGYIYKTYLMLSHPKTFNVRLVVLTNTTIYKVLHF